MGFKTLFGDGVVGFELDPHVVVLGGDDVRLLGAAELAVQLGVGRQPAAHLHKVVFADLGCVGGAKRLGGDTGLCHPCNTPVASRGDAGWRGTAPDGLTSLPSVSKKSNCREMRYWVGATSCQMQFLLGGYSLGHPGLVMEPLSLVRNPPQAAAGRQVPSAHHVPGMRDAAWVVWGGGKTGGLTLAAAFVGRQLVARVAGAFVAAQGVDATLLAAAVIGTGTLVHLWEGTTGSAGLPAPHTPPMEHLLPLKKLTAKPALLMEPSETNFIQSLLEVLLMSSGLS